MQFVKKYNQEIALALFCVGMFCYALGLSSFGKSLKVQTLFHVGGALFILCNLTFFSKRLWKGLTIPIACFTIVCVLGLLTFFDDVWVRPTSVFLKAVNQHIIAYFALFVLMFVFGMYAKRKYVSAFLICFAILCAMELVAMLYLGFTRGFLKSSNTPFFFQAVFTYNIWLLAPAAMSLAGIFAFQKKLYKLLALLALLASVVAMFANGERSFLVACIAMVFVPFFVWHYKYKFKIIFCVICAGFIALASFYEISKTLPVRYNFAHVVDNFLLVWNTKPSAMGQYDNVCFDPKSGFECTPESLVNGKNEIVWEHSALARLNMTKSTLLAVMDSPFKPHLVGVFQIGEYLFHYYSRTNWENRSYINFASGSNGYNSPHNFAVSMLFCYGVIGFLSIVVFQGFLIRSGYRSIKQGGEGYGTFWGLSLIIFVCGICVQSFFDVLYTNILQCIFIWCGVLAGLGWRDETSSHN